MAHSLFMAQQTTTERLEAIELQLSDEDGLAEMTLDSMKLHAPMDRSLQHRRNRSSQIIDGSFRNLDKISTGEGSTCVNHSREARQSHEPCQKFPALRLVWTG
jgi:hypothetical protein